jgi:hypothetical protein
MPIIKTTTERLGRPAFSMDFINSQQFPGWHNPFTRSTTGTFLNAGGYIESAPPNFPRFNHHPETGKPKGLLLEQQSTNYFRDYRFGTSETNPSFNSSNNQGVTMTYGTGGTLSPAGDFTATYVNAGTSTGSHRIISGSNPLQNSAQTFSCYVKPDTTNRVSVDCDNIGINIAYFLSGDGSIHGTPQNSQGYLTDVFIEKWPNGWYRIGASLSSAANGSGNDWRVYLANNTHATSFTATGESIYIWGAQLENNREATSLIKSAGSTVTRTQDYLGKESDGASSLNRIYPNTPNSYPSVQQPSEGGVMLYLHGEIDWSWNSGTNYYYFQWDSTGGNEYYGFRIGGSSGLMTLQVYNNGSYNSITLGNAPVQRKTASTNALPDAAFGEHVKREFMMAASLHPDTGMRAKGRYINTTDNHYYEDSSQLEILSGATSPNLPGNQGYGQLDLFGLSSGQILRNGHIKCLKFWNQPAGFNATDVDDVLTQLVEE